MSSKRWLDSYPVVENNRSFKYKRCIRCF
ncbi:MAG: hypothetical protein JKX96_09015 [Acinetobacter sp.]|nr:hypothetical protein [Acinetobacter sp.]